MECHHSWVKAGARGLGTDTGTALVLAHSSRHGACCRSWDKAEPRKGFSFALFVNEHSTPVKWKPPAGFTCRILIFREIKCIDTAVDYQSKWETHNTNLTKPTSTLVLQELGWKYWFLLQYFKFALLYDPYFTELPLSSDTEREKITHIFETSFYFAI